MRYMIYSDFWIIFTCPLFWNLGTLKAVKYLTSMSFINRLLGIPSVVGNHSPMTRVRSWENKDKEKSDIYKSTK